MSQPLQARKQKKKPLRIRDVQKIATGVLGLSPIEYWDRTLFELSIEIEGYNARWEENMIRTRLLYTLIYNVNAPKGKSKTAQQLIPLPSEKREILFQQEIERMQVAAKARVGK